MQNLSDTYNLRIIQIFGAAGHDKRFIDAMLLLLTFGLPTVKRFVRT